MLIQSSPELQSICCSLQPRWIKLGDFWDIFDPMGNFSVLQDMNIPRDYRGVYGRGGFQQNHIHKTECLLWIADIFCLLLLFPMQNNYYYYFLKNLYFSPTPKLATNYEEKQLFTNVYARKLSIGGLCGIVFYTQNNTVSAKAYNEEWFCVPTPYRKTVSCHINQSCRQKLCAGFLYTVVVQT